MAKFEEDDLGFIRVSRSLAQEYLDSTIYKGKELTHYTNLNGLLGIIKYNGFWMSDHRFLNDIGEYKNGVSLLKKIIENIIQKKKYKIFTNILRQLKLLLESDNNIHYVCSFSTKKDCLNQWKGYAHNDDGVSVVFHNDDINSTSEGHFNIQSAYYPRQIIYSECKKYKILLKIIQTYFIEYKKDIKKYEGETYSDAGWPSHLYMSLVDELINFKHSAFEAESEIRLTLTNKQIKKCELHHRVSNGKIIPYVNATDIYEDELKEKKLPIKEIIVGPISNQDATCHSIKVYLENMGYDKVIIKKSSIPYRG